MGIFLLSTVNVLLMNRPQNVTLNYIEKLGSGLTGTCAIYIIPTIRCSLLCLVTKGNTLFKHDVTHVQIGKLKKVWH